MDPDALGAIVLASYFGSYRRFQRETTLILSGRGRRTSRALRTNLARLSWKTRREDPQLPCSILVSAWRMAGEAHPDRGEIIAWRQGLRRREAQPQTQN